ncbi:MBL fold metallo-hydrolase [Streptomyces mashuensis]|nr:MBL fold metallo-hydrolase [Streptomyces mashuensis]
MTDLASRLNRPSVLRSLRLGDDITVTYLPDGAGELRPRGWLPATTDEDWAAHPQYLDANGNLVASMGALLVEHGDRAMLIDSGFGPHTMEAPDEDGPIGSISAGALLESLAAAGRAPHEIEAVAITHLHPDHIGWAVTAAPGEDEPPFVKADYLMAEDEWNHRHLVEATPQEALDVLAPRVRTVADGEEIFPGVRVMLTPGHTAGHAAYVVTGSERRLIAFGDALHSPVQVDHPEWSAVVDHDPVQSAGHRRRLVDELAQPGTVGFGVHFADVVFGRVQRDGDGPAWRPVDA